MSEEETLGNSLWKDKPLKDMNRTELYKAISELGKLYHSLLEANK